MRFTKASLGAVALTIALPGAEAAAAGLVHRQTMPDFRVVSLAYDAVLCGVWVADESREIALVSPFGRELRRFPTGMRSVRSLTVEDDGLLLADGRGAFQRVTREGVPLDAPFSLAATLRDVEGLHRDADGRFLVVEDDPARLLRVAPDGAVLSELRGEGLDPPMTEPQGVERDPYTGAILVVDDEQGLDSLFELAPDGRVLSVAPLARWGRDAEAVALQPETGTLFVGFDEGRALAIFDWTPSAPALAEPLERGPDCPIS